MACLLSRRRYPPGRRRSPRPAHRPSRRHHSSPPRVPGRLHRRRRSRPRHRTVSSAAGLDPIVSSPRAVAAGGRERLLVVGGIGCTVDSDGATRCWPQTARSEDGATWGALNSTDATEVGGPAVDGPVIGMNDVAGEIDGFVAIGYAGGDGVRAAVWHTTTDGTEWDRIADGPAFDNARPRTVARTAQGWFNRRGGVRPRGTASGAVVLARRSRWERVPDDPAWTSEGLRHAYRAAGGRHPGPGCPGRHDSRGRLDMRRTGRIRARYPAGSLATGLRAGGVDVRRWCFVGTRGRYSRRAWRCGSLVASIDTGFVAVRRDCSSDPCTSTILDLARRPGVARSIHGRVPGSCGTAGHDERGRYDRPRYGGWTRSEVRGFGGR